MMQFAEQFPDIEIVSTLSTQLSWFKPIDSITMAYSVQKSGIPIKAVSQATMGNSAAIWILLIRTLQNFMRFRKGWFIIRDMSAIDAPIKRMNYYTPVDMGVPEEELIAETEVLLREKNKKQEIENGK